MAKILIEDDNKNIKSNIRDGQNGDLTEEIRAVSSGVQVAKRIRLGNVSTDVINIIEIQNTRIEEQKDIIDGLNEILSIL